jgi:hypothetical protein
MDNIADALNDDRCTIFPLGGDVREIDILDKARRSGRLPHSIQKNSRLQITNPDPKRF